MTLFVDASALVAIIRGEPEAGPLKEALAADAQRITSAVALWETARALATRAHDDIDLALAEVRRLCAMLEIRVVALAEAEATAAADAHRRYGKGRHPARLNMGDCFAYACARTNGAGLLYKGNDFSRTDLA